MNGDLLTKIKFDNLIDFHNEHNAMATMCVRQYDMQVPYGVVEIVTQEIKTIVEKPIHTFFVNAGIYAISPEALELIPNQRYFDMTDFFYRIVSKGRLACAFPIREYWIDIGRMNEYERAKTEYNTEFAIIDK